MKKLLLVLGTSIAFTYCNPTQNADETSADTARVGADTTASSTSDTGRGTRDTIPTSDTTRRDSTGIQ